jgi:hypothetical protein
MRLGEQLVQGTDLCVVAHHAELSMLGDEELLVVETLLANDHERGEPVFLVRGETSRTVGHQVPQAVKVVQLKGSDFPFQVLPQGR